MREYVTVVFLVVISVLSFILVVAPIVGFIKTSIILVFIAAAALIITYGALLIFS